MQIELCTKQIYEKHNEKQKQTYQGHLKNAPKGSILEFGNEKENYQMTILENKIILKKPNQTIIFEREKTTNSTLQTPYGSINMKITTNHMKIEKEDNQLKKVILDYQIELENQKPYQNQIEINIR